MDLIIFKKIPELIKKIKYDIKKIKTSLTGTPGAAKGYRRVAERGGIRRPAGGAEPC